MSELRHWLERNGLGDFSEQLAKERIELGDLPHLTENDLRELGLPMGPRKRLLSAVRQQIRHDGDRGTAAEVSRPLSPLQYTPAVVAERIIGARPSVEGERKQVTILFADIKGSTAIVEHLDPEDATALLDPVIVHMIDAVHRYDGTVNRLQGDGIMAMFGAPLAHEDHALRACRAALDILQPACDEGRDTVDHSIEVRVGVNSGEVVVRAIHNDLTMSYDAVGLTAHLAARMEQLAEPGTICMTADTLRLVEGYVSVRSRGPTPVKGLAEPIEVFSLTAMTGALTRIEASPQSDLTRFIGRHRELEIIESCFEAAHEGRGRVVLIVGEPGMGKSRLLLEIKNRLGDAPRWLEGHSLSFAHSMPFHPLPEMLRGYFAIEEKDSEEVIGRKVGESVTRLGADFLPTIPYLRYLLGIEPGEPGVLEMDPQLRRAEIFDAFRRLVIGASKGRTHVFVIEDLHWIDPATEELIAFLVESAPSSRVLCLFTYRPTYVHGLGERTYITRLALDGLDADASAEMARAVLKTARLPPQVEELVRNKAEGNPFFVEEVTRSVFETGAIQQGDNAFELALPVEEIRVPETIQGIIMARVDRLDDASRKTLQLAAIIGREFTLQAMELVGDLAEQSRPDVTAESAHATARWLADIRGHIKDALHPLQAVELVYKNSAFPDGSYAFKHALTQEVVYGSLLLERRRQLHGLAALALEQTLGNRIAEHYALLAHHFSLAEQWQRAFDYLLRAAEKAASAFATREAIALYDQALDLAGRMPEKMVASRLVCAHQAKSEQHFLVSEFEQARAEAAKALQLALGTADRTAEGTALVNMGLAAWLGHDFDQALVDAEQAVAVGSAIGDQSILAGGHLTTGLVYEMTGRLAQAGDKLDEVMRISRAAGDAANESWALVFAAEIKGWEANFDDASRLYLHGIDIARAHSVLLPQLEGLFMYGINLTGKGQYESAFSALEEGLALAEKIGDENYTPRYLNSLGWLCAESGDLQRAIELNQRGSAGARSRGDDEAVANAELNLADIALAQGDHGVAQEILEAVHRAVKDPTTSEWMRWRYSIHLFMSLAELSLLQRHPAAARTHAEQCLDLALRTNSRKYVVHGWRLQASAAVLRRDWHAAESALLKALPVAESIASPTPLWKTHLALAQLKLELRQHAAASRHYRSAVAVVDRVRGGFVDSRRAATLECSPVIQQLYGMRDEFRL